MEYKKIELDYVPNIEKCIGVRTGDTIEKSLENLSWAVSVRNIKLDEKEELICYSYPVFWGGFESVLVPTHTNHLQILYKKDKED